MADSAFEKRMIRAAKHGNVAAIRALAVHDSTLLNAREPDGSTPLHCAAWKGNLEAVEALLELGADIEAQNANEHYGGTALHAAAHGNHKPVAALLIRRGANINTVSCNGRTPLAETTIHNATAVARLLKQHG